MMITGQKEKQDLYRKWFQTFLVTEFFELPIKEQEKFLITLGGFQEKCNKIHEEAKAIKEKTIQIIVNKITPKNDSQIISGTIRETLDTVKICFPNTVKISVGSTINSTVYSLDNTIWYSSKTELITGR